MHYRLAPGRNGPNHLGLRSNALFCSEMGDVDLLQQIHLPYQLRDVRKHSHAPAEDQLINWPTQTIPAKALGQVVRRPQGRIRDRHSCAAICPENK